MKLYRFIILISLLWMMGGCSYSPQRIVEYQPTDIIKGGQDAPPPQIIVTSPQVDRKRGLAVVGLKQKYITIEGIVVAHSKVATLTINNAEVALSSDGSFTHKTNIHSGMNSFAIVAVDSNKKRTEKSISVEGIDQIDRDTRVAIAKGGTVKPTLWVLTVGISEYQNSSLNLKYADNDANVLARTLKKLEGGIFLEVVTKTLVNQDANRGNILTAMATHLGKAAPDDVVFIFLAGHGIKNVQTGSYYFVPYNADMQNLLFEGLKWSDFDEAIKIISTNVSKVVLVLDTCHSGAINVAMRNLGEGEDLADAMKSASGLYVLSASKGGESSMEDESFRLPGEKKGHGAFTYALLKGLSGEANYDKSSYLTINQLFSYVAAQVPRLTKGQQHPYSKIEGTDLPMVLFREK
jgi:hypothetical protein